MSIVKFETDKSFFNARDTLECGQIFRYKSINDDFLVRTGSKCCLLKSGENSTDIVCEEEDRAYFENYFDLKTDYSAICKRAQNSKYAVVREAAKRASGVRILRQNTEEMLFSFIISQNNMIPRIKSIIERTAKALGEKKSFMGEDYYAFPTAESLASETPAFFYELGYGYRAEYVPLAAKAISSGEFNLSADGLSTAELRKKLLTLKGVGPKVADCVALFGYHRTDSFPVDTWIEKLYKEDFGGKLTDRKKISDFFTGEFGEDSGFVQQYVFYYKRSLENQS